MASISAAASSSSLEAAGFSSTAVSGRALLLRLGRVAEVSVILRHIVDK